MKEKRNDLSVMRILATLAVILLHTCSTVCDNPEKFVLTEHQLLFLKGLVHLLTWAVPIFFMLTGILLLDSKRKITFETCLKKYCVRILLVLGIFGIPFAMMKIFMEDRTISLNLILNSVRAVLGDNGWRHLWYLYVLLGIYLILPVLKAFVDQVTEKELVWVLWILFVCDFVFPLISNLTKIEIGLQMPITYHVFYVLFGHYLSRYGDKLVKSRILTGILLIGTVICIIGITCFAYDYLDILISYNSPIIVWLSFLIYGVLVHVRYNFRWNIWNLDRLCFGVYIIHPIAIHLVYKVFGITPVSFNFYPLATIMMWILFSILAFIGSWILYKITILRKYVL